MATETPLDRDKVRAFVLEMRARMDEFLSTLVPAQEPTHDAPEVWIELGAAAKRFGLEKDRLHRWCREKGVGRKTGGRWEVSIERTSAAAGSRPTQTRGGPATGRRITEDFG